MRRVFMIFLLTLPLITDIKSGLADLYFWENKNDLWKE